MTLRSAIADQTAQRDPWEQQGHDIAAALEGTSAAVVLGSNPDFAARVAIGIARATCGARHVAVADLVGDLAPLYALTGGADALGLSDCFRDGLPLNDVARPAPECETLFILPAGTPPVATWDILANERWARLIRGFGEAGALLLLVASLDAPGLDVLAAATGGVVAVDTPPQRVSRFRVLASAHAPPLAPPDTRRFNRQVRLFAMAGLALVVGAGLLGRVIWRGVAARRAAASGTAEVAPTSASAEPPAAAKRPVTPADTVRLGAVVNPGDSANAATFAVEVVAANSTAGANSVLKESEDAVPIADRRTAAVVPVQLGGASLWYKAVVGAWHDRAGADSLLEGLRARGIMRSHAGVVVRVPYALLLAVGVARSRADIVVNTFRSHGIAAYALLQDDGSVRVYAGAFETPAQSAQLAAAVRDAGVQPVIAFRTGRSF